MLTHVNDAGPASLHARAMHQQDDSYRSLERLCRGQAAIATTPGARLALERMALEYKGMADWLEQQWPEPEQPAKTPP